MTQSEKKEFVDKWLRENTELKNSRSAGDSPAIKIDSNFLNRSERYEIKDFIVLYYNCCNIGFTEENIKNTYARIKAFNKGKKTKRIDFYNHLKKGKSNCKDL